MRLAQFEVPAEVMPEFTDELVSRKLHHKLTGTTSDGEIMIEVNYKRNEIEAVNELEEALENLVEQLEEDED